MRTTHKTRIMVAAASGVIALTMVVLGCTMDGQGPRADNPANDAGTNTAEEESGGLSGSELWSRNCGRCHNIHSPDRYSDAEWETVMHHMRVTANLTGEDHRKILDFLKRGN